MLILTLAWIEHSMCSDTAVILLYKFFHLILRKFYNINTIIIPTSSMRKGSSVTRLISDGTGIHTQES